ncbi:MAG: Ig-like domain-containing protein, partial [Bacteroidetes bacterium]|nr:Ig-like domain-containing protein [Bacteroidota bacterium]
ITNPVANKKYNAGALVTISANAADLDGSISEVDFLIDNQLVGVVLKAPYTFVWKATPGVHAIKAVAYDNKNKSTQSTIVNISVVSVINCGVSAWNATTAYIIGDVVSNNNFYYTCIANNFNVSPSTQASIGFWKAGNACPQQNLKPTVAITSPLNNSVFLKPATTTLTASASDADGDISKVVFRRNGIVVGEKTSRPFTVTFAAQAGVSFYTAQAFDNEGGSTSSAAVYVYSNYTDGCTVFPYDAYKYYTAGSLVSLTGNIYKANVATQNQIPAFYSGVGKPWTLVGACGTSFKAEAATEAMEVAAPNVNVLSLYPNPSTGIVTVNLEMQEQSNVTLKVLNVTGAEVAQRTYTATTLINEEMNLSHLSSGLYFV